jgi:hypothetical protein
MRLSDSNNPCRSHRLQQIHWCRTWSPTAQHRQCYNSGLRILTMALILMILAVALILMAAAFDLH